jgi:hypothetical protein
MTVSSASILVFTLYRGCTLYPQVMLPICQGVANPIHLYLGSAAGQHYEAFTNAGFLPDRHRSKINQGPPYTDHSPTALAPFG